MQQRNLLEVHGKQLRSGNSKICHLWAGTQAQRCQPNLLQFNLQSPALAETAGHLHAHLDCAAQQNTLKTARQAQVHVQLTSGWPAESTHN